MIELNEIQQAIHDKYPSYDLFMKEQDPQQLLVNYSDIHEIKEVISKRRITIKEMQDIYSTDTFSPGIDYFAKWLSFFNKFSNLNKTMPPDTIEWVSVHLNSKYCHFYFADLKVIFEQFLETKRGKFYGSVDAVCIMSGFLSYDLDRKRIMDQAKEQKVAERKVWYNQRLLELNREVFNDIETKHPDWDDRKRLAHREQVVRQRIQEEEKKLFP